MLGVNVAFSKVEDMVEKKGNNNQNDTHEFRFLNEHVVKSIRKDFIKGIRLVLIIVGLAGIAVWLLFWRLKPDLRDELNKSLKGTVDTEAADIFVTTEATVNNIEDTDAAGAGPYSEEQLDQMVVLVEYSNENGQKEVPGIVMGKNRDVYIMLYNNELKPEQDVTVQIGGMQKDAKVSNVSTDYKLVIVKIKEEDFSQNEYDDVMVATLAPGKEFDNIAEVILVGNPVNRKNTVERGRLTLEQNIVSVLDAKVRIVGTDLNAHTNERGFVFNKDGFLLGISTSDELSEKVSIIDITDLKTYINRLLNDKKIKYIGIYGKEVTDEVVETIDADMPYGIYIYNTKEDSPAYKAGIMNGDVLVSVAGKEVYTFTEYLDVLNVCQSRQPVKLEVMRKGRDGYKKISYEVSVGELD